MGIYSRDYLRDEGPQGQSFGPAGGQWAIKFLLIANIGVFLLQNLSPVVTDWLALSLSDLRTFEIWRLLTYGFCHDPRGLGHIFFNLFILWMFGRLVEPVYGSREFLSFYLAGVLISGLAHVGVQAIEGTHRPVVGASGGVMAVVFLTAMIYPRLTVYVMFILPMQLRVLAVVYAAVDVLGVFTPGSPVAHAAHLGGAAFGVAYKYFDWRITGLGTSLWYALQGRLKGRTRSRPKVRIYEPTREPPSDDLDRKVDAILKKIHDEGEQSLTEEERRILSDASRRYRHRH